MNSDIRIADINGKINAVEQKLNDPHLCEDTASVSSRISGYYRAIHNWNNGKSQEYKERQEYAIA